MKWYKSLWFKTMIILLTFVGCIIYGTNFILDCLKNEAYGIAKSDWLNSLFAWVSSVAAIFIGLVAVWQNERFKQENDKNSAKAERDAKAYQDSLLEINNRLIQIEENKECSYLSFLQGKVIVVNSNASVSPFYPKIYNGGISNSSGEFKKATVFYLGITNQTNVPIRYFEINEMKISYCNYSSDEKEKIINYGKGGLITSPIIDRGEKITYAIVADGICNIAENLPKGYEINISLKIETTSIYGRTVIQTFLLRLQKENAFLTNNSNKNLFWNYCYESDPIIKRQEVK